LYNYFLARNTTEIHHKMLCHIVFFNFFTVNYGRILQTPEKLLDGIPALLYNFCHIIYLP